MFGNRLVTRWLSTAHPVAFSAFAICGAFSTYFCMYAFRKPFSAGTFEGQVEIPGLGGLDLKILFIISQLLGYCTSKFLGIKIISEMSAGKRAMSIIGVISIAWLALLLFAVLPVSLKPFALFLNGMPLGMVWGLVFGFLEGRKLSEVLGAGLSASYIVASGFVKTVARMIMDLGVTEFWMPFVVGGIFAVPMVFFVWMLASLPPPTAEDIEARVERAPMDAAARKRFFMAYLPGLLPLTMLYILLTAYRDFRDNFAVEIWAALGYADSPEILTTSEIPIAVVVLMVLALIMAFKDNRRALIFVHLVMMSGCILIGASTLLWQMGFIPPAAWMICVGLGLYVGYVPYGCVLFDRLIAAVGSVATAGFLIYVTDAFGYLGSVALVLYKNFGQGDLSWLDFFVNFSWATAIICTVCFAISTVYFARKTRTDAGDGSPAVAAK